MIGRACLVALALFVPAARAAAPMTPEKDVRAALARYVDLVRKMDHAAIAGMFAPDGEIVNPGQESVRGPAAIEAFLRRFADYKVLAETMTAATTTVDGAHATQSGIYRQKVRTPDGKVLNVSGGFDAEWIRDAAGTWRLRRLATAPRRDAVS
jgi:uncharacterized protein (TIGR02246 family)